MAQNLTPTTISFSSGWSDATTGNLGDVSDATYAYTNNSTNSIVVSAFSSPLSPSAGTSVLKVRARKTGFLTGTLSAEVFEGAVSKGTISQTLGTSFSTYSSEKFSVSNYTNLNAIITSTHNSTWVTGNVADVWIEAPDPDLYVLQTIKPNADVSATGWTNAGYTRLADGSDSTYGYCSNSTNLLLLGLETPYIVDPSATATVYWRTAYAAGSGGNLTCQIRQSSTVKGEDTQTVTTTPTTHSFSTAINSFDDLRISFVADALYLRVYDVWVEVLAKSTTKPYSMLWHPF